MSIELPEALILAKQMNEVLIGKKVKSCSLQDYERLQKIGFLNKNISDFQKLVNCSIEKINARGNSIHIKLNNNLNLLLSPEYGGKILYHNDSSTILEKIHLIMNFLDGTALTVRQTNMGVIFVHTDESLRNAYTYKRDFSNTLSPLENNCTLDYFSKLIRSVNRNMKSILVGKDAFIVGVSNSAFQDIIYRAKLHPKRKASSLEGSEIESLYCSIKNVIQERIDQGGKDKFNDLYETKGNYIPVMGPNMKGQKCKECGTPIEKLAFGGGQIYYCPECQYLD